MKVNVSGASRGRLRLLPGLKNILKGADWHSLQAGELLFSASPVINIINLLFFPLLS